MKTKYPRFLTRALFATGFIATCLAESDSAVEQAKAAFAKNDLAAAEALLAPLANAENPDAAACHQLGLVRQRQGRADDAVALFEKATQLDATKAEYFSALGMGLGQKMSTLPMMEQGMLAMDLKKAFARSVELDPDHVTGLIGLARFYTNAPEFAGGSIAKATELAERIKRLVPFLGELELANIAEHGGDDETAVKHYQAAAELAPKHAAAHTSAARLLAKLGRPAEARPHLEAALKLNPSDERTQAALAALPAPTTKPGL